MPQSICGKCQSKNLLVCHATDRVLCDGCHHIAPNVDLLLETWARWLFSDRRYGKTFLGRMLSHMKRPNCPRCQGSGKLKRRDWLKTRGYKICDLCRGKGKIKLDLSQRKINPAFIHGTGYKHESHEDPVSERIDLIICRDLDDKQRLVIEQELFKRGTQDDKAKRLKISDRSYRRYLLDAKNKIAKLYEN